MNVVVPNDIAALFPDVCGHRVILNPKARIRKVTPQEVLTGMVKEVKMPSPSSVKTKA